MTVDELVKYLKNLKAKVVVSNLNIDRIDKLSNLISYSYYIKRSSVTIGIIGVLPRLSSEGYREDFEVTDEVTEIINCANQLVEKYDVFINIILSYCGYKFDKKIASKATSRISIIVGSNSDGILYNGVPPGHERVIGPYPTLIQNKEGETILLVKVSPDSKYLGKLLVTYDAMGKLLKYEGSPIYLDKSVSQDKEILDEIKPWQKSLEKFEAGFLGNLHQALNSNECDGECLFGNFLADALLHHCKNATIALVPPDYVKGALPKGRMFIKHLADILPYSLTWDCGTLEGKYVRLILETGCEKLDYMKRVVHVAGLHYSISWGENVYNRIKDIVITRRQNNKNAKELDETYQYSIGLISSLSHGRGRFHTISENIKKLKTGDPDIKALGNYIKKHTPLKLKFVSRITIKN